MPAKQRVKPARWAFFRAFLKAPSVVASIVPSSPFVGRRVARAAGADSAGVLVELGAGTGGVTGALLEAMPADARLIAVERSSEMLRALEGIDDSRLELVHGCASTIPDVLAERGLDHADAVVSGIPFSYLPEDRVRKIAPAIRDCLAPGGRFVAYQVTNRVVDYMQPLMGPPAVEIEVRNVPPLRVYTWQK